MDLSKAEEHFKSMLTVRLNVEKILSKKKINDFFQLTNCFNITYYNLL